MFNSGLRKEAQRDLEVAVENYEKKVETRQKKLEELYNSRTQLKNNCNMPLSTLMDWQINQLE